MDVHRAARIAAAAHGGQSCPGRFGALADARRARDLGEHRLKDIGEPEWLFQLLIPGRPPEFPPLQVAQHDQPADAGAAHDRPGAELAGRHPRIRRAACCPSPGPAARGRRGWRCRPGGSCSGHFPNGVFFVGLAPLPARMVVPAIADVLGVREAPASRCSRRWSDTWCPSDAAHARQLRARATRPRVEGSWPGPRDVTSS